MLSTSFVARRLASTSVPKATKSLAAASAAGAAEVMRRPPRPRLPPLPPHDIMPDYYPTVKTTLNAVGQEKSYTVRHSMVNETLANNFVNAIGLREDEVIVEFFAGVGGLTRACLRGGISGKDEMQKRADWYEACKDQPAGDFPVWVDQFKDAAETVKTMEDDPPVNKPKAVIVCDPNISPLIFGFGLPKNTRGNNQTQLDRKMRTQGEEGVEKLPIVSPADDRILVLPGDPLPWNVGQFVMNSLVSAGHIPPSIPWSDPPPHITVIAQMPSSVLGERVFTQWIYSIVGASEGNPGWIWTWGRMRMAVTVDSGLYDRLTAKAGEALRNKISVVIEALYDVKPLPPYHHIPNVPKNAAKKGIHPAIYEPNGDWAKKRVQMESESTDVSRRTWAQYNHANLERTRVRSDDFIPPLTRHSGIKEWVRSPVLGLLFTPKQKGLMKGEHRDDWDYVLRHMFVLASTRFEEAILLLGFNAKTLIPLCHAEGNEYEGSPVVPERLVKDLSVEEWVRIVDVFVYWPFKPKDVLMDKELASGNEWDPFAD